MKRGFWIGKMVILGVLFFTLVGFVTQGLWNWLVPELFNGRMITFWQAIGLMALTKILLWGVGGRCQGAHHGGPWKLYWRRKWSSMSVEERERLKQQMKDKWCGPFTAEQKEQGNPTG
jgi:hypothetical protein